MKNKYEKGGQMDPTLERYQSFVFTRLQNESDPQDVYYELLSNGVDSKTAGMVISSVISEMIQKGLFDPTYFEDVQKNLPEEVQQPDLVAEENLQSDVSTQEEEDYDSSYDDETNTVINQYFGDDLDSNVSREDTQGMVSQMKDGGHPQAMDIMGPKTEAEAKFDDATSENYPIPMISLYEKMQLENENYDQQQLREQQFANAKAKQEAQFLERLADSQFNSMVLKTPSMTDMLYPDHTQLLKSIYPSTNVPPMKDGGVIPFDIIAENYMTDSLVDFPGLSEFIPNYEPTSWDDLPSFNNDKIPQAKYGKASKKKFVKNITQNLKKAKKGTQTVDERINSGERQDTLLNDVAAISKNFKDALKNKSTKALANNIFENALKVGDTQLIDMVSGIGQEESLPQAQIGKIVKSIKPQVQEFKSFAKELPGALREGLSPSAIREAYKDYSFLQFLKDMPSDMYYNIFKAKGNERKMLDDIYMQSTGKDYLDYIPAAYGQSPTFDPTKVQAEDYMKQFKLLSKGKYSPNVSDEPPYQLSYDYKLQPITDFNIIPPEEMKLYGDIENLGRKLLYGNVGNKPTFKGNEDYAKSLFDLISKSSIDDEVVRELTGNDYVSKKSLLDAIKKGDNPFLGRDVLSSSRLVNSLSRAGQPVSPSSNDSLLETLLKRRIPSDAKTQRNQQEAILSADMGPISSRLQKLYNTKEAEEIFLNNPYLQSSSALSNNPATNFLADSPVYQTVPLLFANNMTSPRAMHKALNAGIEKSISKLPIGSIMTGAKSLSPDSYLMQYSQMQKLLNDPSKAGMFYKDPLFTGYNTLSQSDILSDFYLKNAHLDPSTRNLKRKDILMTRLSNLDRRNPENSFLEKFGALETPGTFETKTSSGVTKPVFFGEGKKDYLYDFYMPQFGVGKIRNTPLRESGGFVDNELYKFNYGGNDMVKAQEGKETEKTKETVETEKTVDPWEGYEIRKATPNYITNRVTLSPWQARRLYKGKKVRPRGVGNFFGNLADTLLPFNFRSSFPSYTINYIPTNTPEKKQEKEKEKEKESVTDLISYDPFKNNDSTLPDEQPSSRDVLRQTIKDINTDYSGKAKRVLKRGERKVFRQKRRAERNPEGEVPFLFNNPFKQEERLEKKLLRKANRVLNRQNSSNNDLDFWTKLKIFGSKLSGPSGIDIKNTTSEETTAPEQNNELEKVGKPYFMGISSEDQDRILKYAKENNVSTTEAYRILFPMSDVLDDLKLGGLPKAQTGNAGGYESNTGVNSDNSGFIIANQVQGVDLGTDYTWGYGSSEMFDNYDDTTKNVIPSYTITPEMQEKNQEKTSVYKPIKMPEEEGGGGNPFDSFKPKAPKGRGVHGTGKADYLLGIADAAVGFFEGREDEKTQARWLAQQDLTSTSSPGSNVTHKGDYADTGSSLGLFRPDQEGQNTSGWAPVMAKYGAFMDDKTMSDEYDYIPLDGLTEEEIQQYLDMGGVIEY